MARFLVGLLILPLSVEVLFGAVKALSRVAFGASSAAPFIAGMGLSLVAWILGRSVVDSAGPYAWMGKGMRWFYVVGHELTHALAAWGSGGKVFSIEVGEKGGHVDLSESSAFIALAPYCVPLHALVLIFGYRLILWARPATQAETLFLLLIGAALAFHALMTWETLTQVAQPDLHAAGGSFFSLAWIVLTNGLVMLLILKALFPESVALGASLKIAALNAWRFERRILDSVWLLANNLRHRVLA